MPKTPAERKAEQREREAKEGIVQVNVKIHEDHRDDLKAVVQTMQGPKLKRARRRNK